MNIRRAWARFARPFCVTGGLLVPALAIGALALPALMLGCSSSKHDPDAPVAAPVITAQPQTQNAMEGGTATLSVTATGEGLSYQWRRGGASLLGKTSPTLTLNPVATTDAGSYTVVVTSTVNGRSASVTSSAAVVTVLTPAATPVIGTDPASQTVVEGGSVSFSVAATGNGTLTYQWMLGGAPIAGKTDAVLTLNPVFLSDAGSYSVVVTNSLNGTTASATSAAATLTVTPRPILVAITEHPRSVGVTAPDGATFSVTATGANLSYQWKNGAGTVVGTDSPTLTIPATDLHTLSQTYTVTVTSGTVSVVSDPATLTVVAPKPVYAGDPTVTDTSRVYTVVPSFITTSPADPSGSFRVGYDTGKLGPVWSSACFFPSAPWTFARPDDYPTDTRIAGSLVSSDYSNTGYSRGHMTQFANLRDVYGADAGASTMYMSNMCPQVQLFNGGVWGSLETLTTQNLTTAFGRVWIYTGPIYATPLVNPVGAKNIPIATAFYKILVREAAGVPKVLAMILPHSTTVSGTAGPAVTMEVGDLWKFATTVDRVQELTGLIFFPVPSSPLPATFTSVVDVTGWGNTLEQGPNAPNVHIIKPSWDSTFTHVHNNSGAVTTINTYNGLVGDAIAFEGQATPDPDGITSTSWTFGDGSAAVTTPTTSHVYTAAGSYTATFTATDAANHTRSISRVVSIKTLDPTAPNITTQPAAQTVFAGNAVYFTVAATGNGTLSYQWRKNGIDLTGMTAATLKLSAVTPADSGTYSVVVTNTSGSAYLTTPSADAALVVNAVPAKDMYEGFEIGVKGSWAAGTPNPALQTGVWNLTDALIGKSAANGGLAADNFVGLQGVRMRNASTSATGKMTMAFDWPNGAQSVSISLAKYATDQTIGTLGLRYSTNGGVNWVDLTDTFTPTGTTPTTVTWTVGVNQPIRFEIFRTDALSNGRVCIDDFHIVGY